MEDLSSYIPGITTNFVVVTIIQYRYIDISKTNIFTIWSNTLTNTFTPMVSYKLSNLFPGT